jgi:hypothetical protein
MLEVMRVLAGFVSSWNFGKGEDATYITPATPNDIRAGAWQVNANALNFGEELVNLVPAKVPCPRLKLPIHTSEASACRP